MENETACTILLLAEGQSKGLRIFCRYLMLPPLVSVYNGSRKKLVFIYVTAGTNRLETIRIICLVILDWIYYNKVLQFYGCSNTVTNTSIVFYFRKVVRWIDCWDLSVIRCGLLRCCIFINLCGDRQ